LEELVFRGMIQQHMKKYAGPRISVLITAGIFAIAHLGNILFSPGALSQVATLFLLGILTGFAFNKYNSCISSFIPHFVFNLRFIIVVPLMLI
jgi:membrane protease YdiL (CAAX protease family)